MPIKRFAKAAAANIPQLIDELESKGVQYINVMPASADLAGQGRSWQNTLGSISKASAETRLQQLNYTWEWLKDDNLKVTTLCCLPPG